jgi:hypothetical protein
MKAVLYIVISLMLLSIASASVGEYAGFLYFNFTKTNQKLTDTWTLVNTGNTSVSFNVLLPSYNTSSFLIQTSVANGTISANSIYPIQVSVTELSKSNFSFIGTLDAFFQGSGNIAIQIGKKMYVNFGHPSTTTTSVLSTTTVPPAPPPVLLTTTVAPTTSIIPTTTAIANSTGTSQNSSPIVPISILPIGIGVIVAVIVGYTATRVSSRRRKTNMKR